jgi:RNA polymerase sigma factor (sigma-70 family)
MKELVCEWQKTKDKRLGDRIVRESMKQLEFFINLKGLPKYLKEELKAEALAGLFSAMLSFDCAYDVKFMTYAQWQIKNYVSIYLKKHKYPIDPINYTLMTDEIDPERIVIAREKLHNIRELIKNHPKRNIEIFELYVIEGFTLEEIGAKYGITKQGVSLILKKMEKSWRQVK